MFDLAFKSFKESVEMEPEEQPERLRSKPRGTRSLCLKSFRPGHRRWSVLLLVH